MSLLFWILTPMCVVVGFAVQVTAKALDWFDPVLAKYLTRADKRKRAAAVGLFAAWWIVAWCYAVEAGLAVMVATVIFGLAVPPTNDPNWIHP